jgi:Response regulators consisting of a CheY-like receiver domain and a winged-helix DNA-binding domain
MLTTMHILVVEDERKVASFIKRGLEATHYSVDVEHDGEAGLKRLLEGNMTSRSSTSCCRGWTASA